MSWQAWFDHLDSLPAAVVVVVGFVAVTLVAGRLIVKFAPNEIMREHNELAGFIFAVVGVVYAVVLGFVSVGVWERFETEGSRAYAEVGGLTATYRNAGLFEGDRIVVRRDLRRYVDDVITKAWPDMELGISSHQTDDAAERLARDVERLRPQNVAQQNAQAEMLADVDQSLADRDMRLGDGVTGLNGVMWGALLLGAAITIGFSLFFGFKSAPLQMLMTGSLAGIIGIMIFLILALDTPYGGGISIHPDAFERALGTFSQIDAAQR